MLAKSVCSAGDPALTFMPISVNVSAPKVTSARSPIRAALIRIGTDQNPFLLQWPISTGNAG